MYHEVFFEIKEGFMADGDLMHAWELRSGGFMAPPYLGIMNYMRPWHIRVVDQDCLMFVLVVHLVLCHIWVGGRGFNSKCFSRELGEYVCGVHSEVAY